MTLCIYNLYNNPCWQYNPTIKNERHPQIMRMEPRVDTSDHRKDDLRRGDTWRFRPEQVGSTCSGEQHGLHGTSKEKSRRADKHVRESHNAI